MKKFIWPVILLQTALSGDYGSLAISKAATQRENENKENLGANLKAVGIMYAKIEIKDPTRIPATDLLLYKALFSSISVQGDLFKATVYLLTQLLSRCTYTRKAPCWHKGVRRWREKAHIHNTSYLVCG